MIPLFFFTGAQSVAVLQGDYTVPVHIGRTSAIAQVDPAEPPTPMATMRLAERAGIDASLPSASIHIGAITLRTERGRTRIVIDGVAINREVQWLDRPATHGAEMLLGPASLPHPIVRFDLRAPVPGERPFSMPLSDFSGFGLGYGLAIRLGDFPLTVSFTLKRDRTLATAGAGTVLAAGLGGRSEGTARNRDIAFGIARPVQRLSLTRPLRIGPLSVAATDVRVADYGRLRVGKVGNGDPGEIVVTGKSRRDRRYDIVTIGRDDLAPCSSLTIDKARRLLIMVCRPPDQ